MYRLSSIIIIVLAAFVQTYGQSPHGEALKVDCAACHTASGWIPVRDTLHFDHSKTLFPLEGRHLQTDCKECHTSLVFNDASSQCINCHTDIHNMTVGNDCARCHSPQSWIVDHIPELHEQSGFPLVGAHNTPTCVECHISETNLRFNPIGNDCINCHRDEYVATTNPDHEKVGYSMNCIECHDPFSPQWNAELVNHDFFPLVDGHDNKGCTECHLTGNYSDASPECASCHMDNYSATSNPNHISAGFSNDCAQCHNIRAWVPSSFDHNTVYPLVDAHKEVASNCNLCHAQGYSNTPTTCVGCHLADYNATNNPNHTDAQFPTDCAQCHNEKAWTPSTFDHDGLYFPINSGKHKDAWNLCTECHTTSGNYALFSCIKCHKHSNQTEVNNDHKEVGGYTYESNACFSCHPKGD